MKQVWKFKIIQADGKLCITIFQVPIFDTDFGDVEDATRAEALMDYLDDVIRIVKSSYRLGLTGRYFTQLFSVKYYGISAIYLEP